MEISRLERAWRWAELKIHWISTHCQQPPDYWRAFHSSCFHTDKLNDSFSQHSKYPVVCLQRKLLLLPGAQRDSLSMGQACHVPQEEPQLCRSHESSEKAPLPVALRARDTQDTSALLCRATWWTTSYMDRQEKSLWTHTKN